MKKSRLFFSLVTLFSDFSAIVLSFGLAYLIRTKFYLRPIADTVDFYSYLKLILITATLGILIFALNGLYDLRMPSEKPYQLRRLFVAVSASAMLIIVADFTQEKHIFPAKSIPVYGWLLSLLFVFGLRQLIKYFQRYLYKFNIGTQNTIILGNNKNAQNIIKEIKSNKNLGYQIHGVLTETGEEKDIAGIKVVGTITSLEEILKTKKIDEIILANSKLEKNNIIEMINLSDKYKIEFKLSPSLYDVYASNSRISVMGNTPIIEIIRTPLEGWGRIIKRLLDLLGSTVGLILFSPIMIVVSLIIKLTDRGPIIYKQKRIGRNGQIIEIYKFRSMVIDADEKLKELLKSNPDKKAEFEKEFKIKDDPRITSIGKFLRKTSLDELPQFINIFKGQMSLVGPRPIVKEEMEKYGHSRYQRMIVKPGLTGLWQISGRNDLSYQERSKLDIYYIENWSIFLDLKIIFKTFSVFFKKNGAY